MKRWPLLKNFLGPSDQLLSPRIIGDWPIHGENRKDSTCFRKAFSIRALKVNGKFGDPQSDEEALAYPDREHWQKAMEEEFDSLHQRNLRLDPSSTWTHCMYFQADGFSKLKWVPTETLLDTGRAGL